MTDWNSTADARRLFFLARAFTPASHGYARTLLEHVLAHHLGNVAADLLPGLLRAQFPGADQLRDLHHTVAALAVVRAGRLTPAQVEGALAAHHPGGVVLACTAPLPGSAQPAPSVYACGVAGVHVSALPEDWGQPCPVRVTVGGADPVDLTPQQAHELAGALLAAAACAFPAAPYPSADPAHTQDVNP